MRYIKGALSTWVLLEPFARKGELLDVWVDTDYGGEVHTRRSTSSAVVMLDGVPLRCHSRAQTAVATSRGESEYYGLASGLAEALGVRSLLGAG